jgi:hypothetical protein
VDAEPGAGKDDLRLKLSTVTTRGKRVVQSWQGGVAQRVRATCGLIGVARRDESGPTPVNGQLTKLRYIRRTHWVARRQP